MTFGGWTWWVVVCGIYLAMEGECQGKRCWGPDLNVFVLYVLIVLGCGAAAATAAASAAMPDLSMD